MPMPTPITLYTYTNEHVHTYLYIVHCTYVVASTQCLYELGDTAEHKHATHFGGGGPFAGGGLLGGGGFRLSPDGGGGRDPPGGGGLEGLPPPLFPEEGLVGVVMTSLGPGD